MKILYHFPGCTLEYVGTGEVYTRYPDGAFSGCGIVPGDEFHGPRLGITPAKHRLLHELAHHMVGMAMPEKGIIGCPIIWRDAHSIPQVYPEADTREWIITGLSYHALSKVNDPWQFGALIDLAKAGHNPYEMGSNLKKLLNYMPAGGVRVEI